MDFEKLIDRCMRTIDDRNLTNRDVARLADISEATVSRVLATRGRNASMSTIIAICDGLGIEEETIQYDISPNDVTSLEHVYLSLIVFIVIVLAVDLLIPTVGWFRGW